MEATAETTAPKETTTALPVADAGGQPKTPAANANGAATSASTAATGTNSEPTEADLTKTEVAIKRIAAERKKALEAEAKVKDADLASAARKALESGDPMAFIKAFGKDPHEVYNSLTDAITKAKNASVDPVKTAEEIVAKKLEEFKKEATNEANSRVEKAWQGNVTTFLSAAADNYPGVMKALALGEIDRSDLFKVALALDNAGQKSDPKSVLDHVAKDYGGETKASDSAAVGAPPASKTSVAPPKASVADEDLSLNDAFAKAKAKFLAKN
jgi:hypothetical protein